MKLDRNTNTNRLGKYALLKLRELAMEEKWVPEIYEAVDMLVDNEIVDFGNTQDTEFFVIRLKDKHAAAALEAYAISAQSEDPEFSQEVMELAKMARAHPNKKSPS